jgi:hypothetical protein
VSVEEKFGVPDRALRTALVPVGSPETASETAELNPRTPTTLIE